MTSAPFIHLHVHTAYSLLEGALKVKELAKVCREYGMPAVAMTDTNNLFGGVEFSQVMAENGVQPILGALLKVQRPLDTTVKSQLLGRDVPSDNLVVLAQNQQGYRNLLAILSRAYMDSPTGDPIITLPQLTNATDGLIALSGGVKGTLGQLWLSDQHTLAQDVLQRLQTLFPGRFYLELMRHGLPEEQKLEDTLIDWAYKHELPLVATNDVFFLHKELYEAHDALMCISQGRYLGEDDRPRLTPEHYFKTSDEMRALFSDIPEAIENTLQIAKRCAVMVEASKPLLPSFPTQDGRTEKEELRTLASQGLEKRLKDDVFTEGLSKEEQDAIAKPYWERLEYELQVIDAMGYNGYFLIVADFVQWAQNHNIPVGPGRGSGAGSVIAWTCTITGMDPLRYQLIFERFLNPERVSMPDFDIDFCQDRRDEVISYVQQRYGRDRVAQIITFGTLQARAVVRDVGRVLQMPYGQVDKISKLIPNTPGQQVTLDEAMAQEPALREMYHQDDQVQRLIDMARQLEGLYRHASTHAAGVVIGDRPLQEITPLYRDPRSELPATQYNMKYVETVGLVKFDFLGLTTLTILAKATEMILKENPTFELHRIPMDDAKTFALLCRVETVGIFQLEGTGMRDVLRKLQPEKFEEIIALVALYRPGPMDDIPRYLACRHGHEPIAYLHPLLEPILKETFGVMVYQEQVMQIAQVLGGYSLGGADLLRRAMGKKIKSEMDKQRATFVEGCLKNDIPQKIASQIFDQMAKFAGYGFNKSHSAPYGYLAYQTAYMKANYPVEFMAATMTYAMHNTDKLNLFKQELTRMGIVLLPPDINMSQVLFSVEATPEGKAVRYALGALKNVGVQGMELVIAERAAHGPFKSLEDFIKRVDPKTLNRRQFENLVRAGALDNLHSNRQELMHNLNLVVGYAQEIADGRNRGQSSLFGDDEASMAMPPLQKVMDWSPLDRLKEEFEAIGFYLSAHPMDAYQPFLERLDILESHLLLETNLDSFAVAGIVIGSKVRTSKKGSKFAFVSLSDRSGIFEVTVFSDTLARHGAFLTVGSLVLMRVAARRDGEEIRLTVQDIQKMDEALPKLREGFSFKIQSPEQLKEFVQTLNLCTQSGTYEGRLLLDVEGYQVTIKLPRSLPFDPRLMSFLQVS